MKWIYLFAAGVLEIFFALSFGKLKSASGIHLVQWSNVVLVSLVGSLFLLYKATLQIPITTAYAVWTGIGAGGTVVIGLIFFESKADRWHILFLVMLITSIIGLKITSK